MEEWRSISGYEGLYEVSDLGRVRSLPRATTKGRVLKPYISKHNGYCYVTLSKNNNRASKRVHTLIMSAFNPIDKKPGYDKNHTINHKDGDKTNNRLSNLEWLTQSENQIHAFQNGLERIDGEKVISLDTLQVFESYSQAARSVGGKLGELVARVCRGERSHYRNAHFARLKDYQNGCIPEYKGKTRKKGSETLWR